MHGPNAFKPGGRHLWGMFSSEHDFCVAVPDELRICSDEAVSKCSEQIATQSVSSGGKLWAMRAKYSFSFDRIRDAGFGGTARRAEWREFDTHPDAYSHTQTRTESGEMR